jgi:hypothetical protein
MSDKNSLYIDVGEHPLKEQYLSEFKKQRREYEEFSMFAPPREYISFHRFTNSHNLWRAFYYRDNMLVTYTTKCFETKEQAAEELFKYLPDWDPKAFDKKTEFEQDRWDNNLACRLATYDLLDQGEDPFGLNWPKS